MGYFVAGEGRRRKGREENGREEGHREVGTITRPIYAVLHHS